MSNAGHGADSLLGKPGTVVRAALLISLTAASLTACASGGGGGDPPPPPSPIGPPPPPPPPPSLLPPFPPPVGVAAQFETAEYFGSEFRTDNRSGLGVIGASSAYARGATGQGIVVAVIDTGVDADTRELAGQFAGVHDVVPGRSATDIDDGYHGTLVSSVIVAKKDGTGIHGVAYEAKVLSIRADTPGSCQTTGEDEGCSFGEANVAAAINYAVANGARVINMSLGGEPDNDPRMENAIRAAVAAGVLVVISAGNDGELPTATEAAKGTSPSEPANIAGTTDALGRVVAVGAIDRNRKITDFSNRAAQTKTHYLLAPGQSVITAGEDDNYYSVSGTSFAAPHVAGALALMLDLFPNIAPENALKALLITADDYVDAALDPILGIQAGAGADDVSGMGILNLARAFNPIGATTMSFDGVSVPLNQALGPAQGATGDWVQASGAFDGLVFQDVFERGFRIGQAGLTAARAPFSDFAVRADYARGQARAFTIGPAQLAWFNAPPESYDPRKPWAEAPDPAFTLRYSLGGTEFAGGQGGGPDRIATGMMLVDDRSGSSVLGSGDQWASFSHAAGPVTFDLRTSSGSGRSASGAGISRTGEGWGMRLGYASYTDEVTALGGSLQSRFGGDDASRLSAISFEAAREIGGWRLSGAVEGATADIPMVNAAGVWTSAWLVSAEHPFAGGDLRFSAAQPRRAEGGELSFSAPVEVLKSGALRFEDRVATLTPSGREVDLETSWRTWLDDGTSFETAAVLSMQANHIASADPETAVWAGLRRRW